MSGAGVEKASPFDARSASRLAAVQAFYQIEFGGGCAEDVIAEFLEHRLGASVDGDRYAAADPDFFHAVVRGGIARAAEIETLLSDALSRQRLPSRLDGILRSLLCAAAFELLGRRDVPARVVIDEYLDVAHAFFVGTEPKLINGVLDAVARRLRPEEVA